jgi:hypothetical protein
MEIYFNKTGNEDLGIVMYYEDFTGSKVMLLVDKTIEEKPVAFAYYKNGDWVMFEEEFILGFVPKKNRGK